ncbi:CHAT domain-containing protein, partial [Vararia minispora EC-137]
LNTAISHLQDSINLTSDDHPHKPARVSDLGMMLYTRFKRLGRLSDLDDAITVLRQAVNLAPDDHAHKLACLYNLGSVLEARFDHFGQLNDLEDIAVVKRQAVDLIPDGHPNKPARCNDLTMTLQTGFERLGQPKDLEDAIAVQRQAVDLTPDDHPNKPAYLSTLGRALGVCFLCFGQPNDLESAIVVHRQAVDITPDRDFDKPTRLNNLGNALKTRFDRFDQLNDLEEAVMVMHLAIDTIADDHPHKPSCLTDLGTALETRFKRLGQLSDLENAITVKRQAVDLTPDGHPDKSICLNSLGEVFCTRFCQNHDQEDLESAFSAFILALDQESGPPSARLNAVEGCIAVRRVQAQFGRITYQDLMNTFDQALSLVPQVAWLGPNTTQRRAALSSIGNIVKSAVSAAIQTGNLSRAIEWLEEGRSVVLGQLLQLRSPVDNLRSHHPDLADRLQSLSHNLEASGNELRSGRTQDSLLHSGSDMTLHGQVSVRIKLAQDYQDLLRQIREQDGFKNFLMPRPLAELVPPRRTDGPIVIIIVDPLSCDALVVHGSDEPLIHVPLPNLTFKLAENMRLAFTQSLKKAGVRERKGVHDDRFADSVPRGDRGASFFESPMDPIIARVLKNLWLHVVKPILDRIKAKPAGTAVTDLPHVTWCPTGPLAFLPIHAAGMYGRRGTLGDGMKLFDIAVSSYTPTLSALLRPAHTFVGGWPSVRALVVSQPKTPGMSMLPGVASEVANIWKHLGGQVEHLDGEDATTEAVLHAMGEDHCQLVHLACHGLQNTVEPSKSAFVLYDGYLTPSQLMSSSVRNGALAFLSACETPTGDEKPPEEAGYLATGMLAMGFNSVIGTMWSAGDQDAPIVADEVYRRLKEGCVSGDGRLKTAYALHEAVKVLREKVGESNVTRWAPYIHFGI